MKIEKRLKTKRVMVRVSDELYKAFTDYAKEHSGTKTEIIETFLKELLKNKLKV